MHCLPRGGSFSFSVRSLSFGLCLNPSLMLFTGLEMYVYHCDDFTAGPDILYVSVWFKINVVLKLVQGHGASNISRNLNFSKKNFSNTYLS